MINKDQIQDCLGRSWIVLVPNHRLCPQVNLHEGPMQDCRDLLAWIRDESGFAQALGHHFNNDYLLDQDHVFAMGTSSGGTLALSLGFDVPRPVAGIYDMYGPCHFTHDFWTTRLPHVADKLPPHLTNDFISQVFREDPVPIKGGVSLEGQAGPGGAPNFRDPRVGYAMTQIGNGTVLDAIMPSREWDKVDPLRNITPAFPPTFIAHGQEDNMVPLSLSHDLLKELRESGVRCDLVEVPNEGHTFAGKMQVGSLTWQLQRRGFDFLERLIRN
ncbi:Alpha/Beta hydrolase protein [Microdochium bolleyi]|uniref:Alpha/Beta hydrolase protein n=1 Tax=Microdochium bolleyi TaxID=196109 RepID=A0A136ILA3_9PEZI|nr:Alpha/Beta hydrolase protein [Microdochium bolleyi]